MFLYNDKLKSYQVAYKEKQKRNLNPNLKKSVKVTTSNKAKNKKSLTSNNKKFLKSLGLKVI